MAQRNGDEALFRTDLLGIVEKDLEHELTKQKLLIGEKIKILYDITATAELGKFVPSLGFLEQDIVIFQEASVDHQLSRHFRMTSDWATVRVPRLVIEVKYNGINSHTLMTYSNIAQRIKGIFSSAKYYLLLRYDNKNSETLLRHGIGFDRIVLLQRVKGAEWGDSYRSGDFEKQLVTETPLSNRFQKFLHILKLDLADQKLVE